jgi:serine/threonine-protein kinase
VLLEPYVSYRGERVIGAWRWLPEYGIGVAAELAADEAYAPLAFLNVAFTLIFAALAVAMSAALLYVMWLKRQMGKAHRLGAYVLERKIGEGGMARVYLARHALLRRPTAVKILRPERSTEQFVARFEREVKLASQLTHPNTVEIYDYGRTADGLFYYAMEYLEGVELLDLLKDGPVPVERTIYLLRQACAGLAEAHAKGLVHRDIKPENLMICTHGGEFDVVKILDFGLVKSVTEPQTRDLTRTIRFLGTPQYMAPERFRSPADVDARADIYSLGAVAFYMLTGRELFQGADDLELSNRVLNDEVPRPSTVAAQAIPVELDLLVVACLEKRREDRPQRVTDLMEAFDALAVTYRWTQRDAADWWAKRTVN